MAADRPARRSTPSRPTEPRSRSPTFPCSAGDWRHCRSLASSNDASSVGSANSVFHAIRSDDQPFYEFFRIVPLPGLEPDECRRLLQVLADQEGGDRRPVAVEPEDGRLETIRRLTGGNPRLLVLTCRMLRESPLGSATGDLERLIDEQTPYFKARIEALPTLT